MSLEKRLHRLEYAYLQRIVQATADAFGVEVGELLEECRRFFALSDSAQDAEFAASLAEAVANGDDAYVRLLTEGCAAIRSYR
jgi:hypothetical protein